ncbi:ATP-binding protein [Rhodoferax sp. PAMC 29310]|uniref:ATP-binding protein n=1 Tax=Rhodoferax sp. PAMC 29310 TaxID=2822760 RepID=UPI001B321D07|nr:ATP-binding protein [Rhodoferax sp. PAMC 29310]
MNEALEEKKIFQVDEVFTPSSPAIACYVPRDERTNDKLVNALKTRGKQIVVYGHSGSGKTTLLLNKLNEVYENHLTSRCMKGMTVDLLLQDAFSQLAPFYEVEVTTTKKSSEDYAIEASFQTIKASINSSKGTDQETKSQRLVQPQLTAHALAKLLGVKGLYWVIEDFHKVDDPEKKKLSQVMKIFMDCGAEYPLLKIITLGAVQTARQVVEYDDEMRNPVSEIEIHLMEHDEILKIISTGETRLNIEFSDKIKKLIAKYSAGLPAACHQLCLNACHASGIMETGSTVVKISNDDIKKAVETYVEETSDSIRSRFEKALKPNRNSKHNIAKNIIQLLSDYSDSGASRFELLQKIKREIPTYTDSSLRRMLSTLTLPTSGEVIRHSQNSGLYAFSNPLYHAYAMTIFHKVDNSQIDIENIDLDFPTLVRLLEKELQKRGVQRAV